MNRYVAVLILVVFAIGGASYRLIQGERSAPSTSEKTADEPAPMFLATTSMSTASSLQALAEPFLEVFETDPEVLFELNLDEQATDRMREQKRSAWIDVISYSAVAYEITMRESHFSYLGIRWKIDGRETNAHRRVLFHWPYTLPADRGGVSVTNRYDYLPVPPGATAICADFGLCEPQNLRKISKLRVLGYRTTTTKLKNTPRVVEDAATNTERHVKFEFPSLAAKNLQGRVHGAGVRLRLQGVTNVRVMTRDHRIQALNQNIEWTLGSFLPHEVFFTNAEGGTCNLRVNQAELLQLRCNPDAKTLEVKAYYYHYAERSITNHEENVRFDANTNVGWRHHFNKGAATSLPGASLTIGLACAESFFAPLWQPEGRLATFIFVEHADHQETESDVLFMYGNKDRKNQPGVGFIGNRLPITKTIFLIGGKGDFIKKYDGVPVNFQPVSFLGDQDWRDLLLQYRAEGVPIEFGAHTPGAASAPKADNLLAMRELTILGGRVWTDHGSVMANISRNGWNDKDDNSFMLAALKSHRICYLNALNDTFTDKTSSAGLSQVMDNAPSPLLFPIPPTNPRHVNDNTLFLFTTLVDQTAWLPRTNRESVQEFVRNRSIAMHHCYLADECLEFRIGPDGNRLMTLRPEANRGMQALAKARDDGDLYVSTVGHWADYVRGVRALIIRNNGTEIAIENPGKNLKDVTFMLRSANSQGHSPRVFFDGKEVTNLRQIEGATYFHTDVAHGKHCVKRLP